MEEIRAKKEAAQKKLEEVKKAGAETWEKLRDKTDKALEEVKTLWESLKTKFQ